MMRKVVGRSFAPILLLALIGLGVSPAGAASDVAPHRVAAAYTLYYDYSGSGWYSNPALVLTRDHTGSDGTLGDGVSWSTSKKAITIVFLSRQDPGVSATYLGTVTRSGLNSKRHPGTMSSSIGSSGVWYAVRTR